MIPTRMCLSPLCGSNDLNGISAVTRARAVDELAHATSGDERRRQREQAHVCHDGVADLELRLAVAPRLEAHRQLADAVSREHAAQHDLRHRREAVRAETDAL